MQGVLRNLRSSKDVNLNDGAGGDSPSQEKLTGSDSQDLESGRPQNPPRKRKTSQNVHSHGSFFLRVGAIGKFVHVRISSVISSWSHCSALQFHRFPVVIKQNFLSFSSVPINFLTFIMLRIVITSQKIIKICIPHGVVI